jgi:hypothetical protein
MSEFDRIFEALLLEFRCISSSRHSILGQAFNTWTGMKMCFIELAYMTNKFTTPQSYPKGSRFDTVNIFSRENPTGHSTTPA